MIRCPKCQSDNFDGTAVCQGCGSPLPVYTPPTPGAYVYPPEENDDVSFAQWLLVLFGTCIPLVNIVLLIIIAIKAPQPTLRGFGRGMLIVMGVTLVLLVILALIILMFISQF